MADSLISLIRRVAEADASSRTSQHLVLAGRRWWSEDQYWSSDEKINRRHFLRSKEKLEYSISILLEPTLFLTGSDEKNRLYLSFYSLIPPYVVLGFSVQSDRRRAGLRWSVVSLFSWETIKAKVRSNQRRQLFENYPFKASTYRIVTLSKTGRAIHRPLAEKTGCPQQEVLPVRRWVFCQRLRSNKRCLNSCVHVESEGKPVVVSTAPPSCLSCTPTVAIKTIQMGKRASRHFIGLY